MTSSNFRAQVLSPSELSNDDIAAWRSFNLASCDTAVSFLSYAYARAAESAFPHVRVCRIGSDKEVAAFFPFQFRSPAYKFFGAGERLGGELSDYFGIVAAAEFKIAPAELLRACRLEALIYTHLDDSQNKHGLTGERPEIGHRIDLPRGGASYWHERRILDKKFVSDTERRERNLVRAFGEIRFQFRSDSRVSELARLISTKREQYARTGVNDSLRRRQDRKFLDILSQTVDPLCCGIISTLYAGNTWVASHFGLLCGSTLHYWFPVYNPDLKAYGPGRLLLKQILNAQEGQFLTRIDRGAGDTMAKRDFATSQHFFQRGMWKTSTIKSAVYHTTQSVMWRIAGMREIHRSRQSTD